jgi:hypothetical protein
MMRWTGWSFLGWPVRLSGLFLVLLTFGCASRVAAPTAAPLGEDAPVALRNFEMASIDGHRAVLLRLSRIPTSVRYSDSSRPAQITIQAWGPMGDTDLPERVLPQIDPLVSQVRVSRSKGGLQVVLDLQGNEPPPFVVHEMADWIMIRFTAPEGGTTPESQG